MMRLPGLVLLLVLAGTTVNTTTAQKKAASAAKPASPKTSASQVMPGGTAISISYGQPSVRGRIIGKDVEPMEGEIWRAGANEATVFEVNKPVTIDGKMLSAGKYAFFTIKKGEDWTLIFNKTWKTWGAYEYEKNKAEDALQITVKGQTASPASEKLTYKIGKDGIVQLLWGKHKVAFKVEESRLVVPVE